MQNGERPGEGGTRSLTTTIIGLFHPLGKG
jgi:hypothetical protein